MYARSPEGRLYPADSAPLLCFGGIPPGVLRPVLEPLAQERQGPVGVGLEEGHRNVQGAGTPLP